MAVSVAQLCHQKNPGRIQCLLLYYGAYGLTESASWQKYGNANFEFTREDKEFYLANYLNTEADRDDPRFKVLGGDISLLPKAFIAAAECDPLQGDSTALYGPCKTQAGQRR